MMGRTITLTYNLRGRDTDDDDESILRLSDYGSCSRPGDDSDVSAFTIRDNCPDKRGNGWGRPQPPQH